MDPIHGGIAMFTHERKIIDHPLFLRLRHIKQNDILFYVFPGATHNRFEHCVGTMHVASRIFKNMLRNYIGYRNIKELTKEKIKAIQYVYGCLRIAGLMHDLGHMPFSHQFEESNIAKELFNDHEFINELWQNELQSYQAKPQSIAHEHFSLICAVKILMDIKKQKPSSFPFEIEDIIGMMENGKTSPSNKFISYSIKLLEMFYDINSLIKEKGNEIKHDVETYRNKLKLQISLKIRGLFKDIISGELDADKMDYLLRDSHFSGAKYGDYHIDHLVKNMCVGWDINPEDIENSWIGIALNEKGKGAFEDFVHSRFRMYLQVYNHKSVINFKWLIRQAVFEIAEVPHNKEAIIEKLKDLNRFTEFTDTYFWEMFRKYALDSEMSACYYIINRKKLDYIKSMRADLFAPFEIEKERRKLEKKHEVKVIGTEAPSKFSKINPLYEKIRLLKFDKITKKPELYSIHSDYFEQGKDINVKHFFKAPDFYNK
jgi:HD superfamily phosphohydrolase